MKNYIIVLLLAVFLSHHSFSQQTIKTCLNTIESNNLELKAFHFETVSAILDSKQRFIPPGPEASFDLLNDIASNGGYSEFVIAQKFEFPLVYLSAAKNTKLEIGKLKVQYKYIQQQLRANTGSLLVEMIYLSKLENEYENRVSELGKLSEACKTGLEKGEFNQLDYNKSRVQLVEARTEWQRVVLEKERIMKEVKQLNGGKELDITGLDYDRLPEATELKSLVDSISKSNLVYVMNLINTSLAENEKKIARLQYLPEMEAGFRMDQAGPATFRGLHIGFTLPIWDQSLKIRSAENEISKQLIISDKSQIKIVSDLNFHFESYLQLKELYSEQKNVLNETNLVQLLTKSLDAGQIGWIDFYRELSQIYHLTGLMLENEMNMHQHTIKILNFLN